MVRGRSGCFGALRSGSLNADIPPSLRAISPVCQTVPSSLISDCLGLFHLTLILFQIIYHIIFAHFHQRYEVKYLFASEAFYWMGTGRCQ